MKINPQLQKKIQQIVNKNPSADEETVCEQIISQRAVRVDKSTIKSGVKEYFKRKSTKNGSSQIEVEEGPKKKVKKMEHPIAFEDDEIFKFENLGGIDETLKEVQEYILKPISHQSHFQDMGTIPYKGFLLCGPCNSGKTLLANCILSLLKNKYQFNAFSIDSGSLISNDGEDKLKKIFEACRQNKPSVVLLDNVDLISSKEGTKRPQGSLLPFLLGQLEKATKQGIICIGTSSNPEKIDVSMKKLGRFEKMINIQMGDEKSRQEILKKILLQKKHILNENDINDLSKKTSGFMAGDFISLLKEASIKTISHDNQLSQLKIEHFESALRLVEPIMKKEGFTSKPQTTLDDVGGLHSLKLELQNQIILPIKHQDKFKEINFEVKSGGVLLYGPPGCGKTMLAKAIANAVGANFILVNGPQLLNKYVGQSEQAVRQVFGRAQRASPCIIFFDQFDAIAPKRSDNGNQVTERVVNTLLTSLDGVEERKMVFVIAATNRKDMIDEATLRAGRIQKHLYVPQPNKSERVEILKAITRKMKFEKEIDFEKVSEMCQNYSGADLKMLIREATVNAVKEQRNALNSDDIKHSLEKIREEKEQSERINIQG